MLFFHEDMSQSFHHSHFEITVLHADIYGINEDSVLEMQSNSTHE